METTTTQDYLQEQGYANLTAAIKAEQPIDWEQLDGRKVWCENDAVGTLRGVLERDLDGNIDHPSGWTEGRMDGVYISALMHAWYGRKGWSVWIKGEIPLRRVTADTLPLGTGFKGQVGHSIKDPAMLIKGISGNLRVEVLDRSAPFNTYVPDTVEVLEVYGIGMLGAAPTTEK